jgi:hypothetical protein
MYIASQLRLVIQKYRILQGAASSATDTFNVPLQAEQLHTEPNFATGEHLEVVSCETDTLASTIYVLLTAFRLLNVFESCTVAFVHTLCVLVLLSVCRCLLIVAYTALELLNEVLRPAFTSHLTLIKALCTITLLSHY